MREPSLRASRMAIAGGVMSAAALAAAGFMLGRAAAPKQGAAPNPAPVASASPAPEPVGPHILRRADLILIGERASQAFLSGSSPDPAAEAIAGRRFELIIPFGCNGPEPETSEAPLRWNYDAATQTLRIHAAPSRWTAANWGLFDADLAQSALEGFWISRPWNPAEQCPKIAVAAGGAPIDPTAPSAPTAAGGAAGPSRSEAAPAERTLAVVAIRAADARRESGQRPYAIVRRMLPEAFAPASGFHLKLSGRIDRLANGASARCVQPPSVDQRPACFVAVALDEVAIVNPFDGGALAAWSMRRD